MFPISTQVILHLIFFLIIFFIYIYKEWKLINYNSRIEILSGKKIKSNGIVNISYISIIDDKVKGRKSIHMRRHHARNSRSSSYTNYNTRTNGFETILALNHTTRRYGEETEAYS